MHLKLKKNAEKVLGNRQHKGFKTG